MGTRSSDGSRTSFSQRIIRLSGEGRLYWPGEGTTQAFGIFEAGFPPPLGSDGQRATKYGPQLGLTVAVNATLRLPI